MGLYHYNTMNREQIASIFIGLTDQSREILVKTLSPALISAIQAINKEAKPFVPPPHQILECFKICPFENTRVVLLGQDPYIKPGEAHGLSFSTLSRTTPPSLRKIYECMVATGCLGSTPTTNDLTPWAKQGVLLLNTALTTQLGISDAHAAYWTGYTDGIIHELNQRMDGLIFILLGAKAQAKRKLIDTKKHSILEWGHPSPLNSANRDKDSPNNFIRCDVFHRTNSLLESAGKQTISWALEGSNMIEEPTVVLTSEPIRHPTQTSYRLYTDGGAIANGKTNCQASWAYIIYAPDGTIYKYAAGRVAPSTHGESNNRGELSAIFLGVMEFARGGLDAPLVILSDSEYSLKCISVWYPEWVRKSKLDGKKNLDLIAGITQACVGLTVTYRHVSAHCDEPMRTHPSYPDWDANDIVDDACNVILGRPSHRAGRFVIV